MSVVLLCHERRLPPLSSLHFVTARPVAMLSDALAYKVQPQTPDRHRDPSFAPLIDTLLHSSSLAVSLDPEHGSRDHWRWYNGPSARSGTQAGIACLDPGQGLTTDYAFAIGGHQCDSV